MFVFYRAPSIHLPRADPAGVEWASLPKEPRVKAKHSHAQTREMGTGWQQSWQHRENRARTSERPEGEHSSPSPTWEMLCSHSTQWAQTSTETFSGCKWSQAGPSLANPPP